MRQIIAAPAIEAHARAELAEWLGIGPDRESALLETLLATSLALCERFTGRFALATQLRATLAASAAPQALPGAPLIAVASVEALGEGTARSLAAGDYRIGPDPLRPTIALLRSGAERQLAVTFTAGTASDWTALDPALRHGIVRHAAHLYRERDSAADAAIPAAVAALWRPFRTVRL